MATQTETAHDRFIRIRAHQGVIAQVRPTTTGLAIDVFVPQYEAEIKRIVEMLQQSELPVWVPSRSENDGGKVVIHDKVKYCRVGDPDFVYALASELGYYYIEGAPIVAEVRINATSEE